MVKEEQIEAIVREVLRRIDREDIKLNEDKHQLGVFDKMEDAIEAAKDAFEKFSNMTLEDRERFISEIRKATLENARVLAEMGVKETGMGKVEHKVLKHQLVAKKTPGTEDLKTQAWSGDKGLTLVEMAPFGVIGAITPSTNPSETIICNSIGMIAAGNAVVFSPHPGAKRVSNFAVDMINRAIIRAGGPENLVVSIKEPSINTTNAMIKHPDVKLLVATGGPEIVKIVLSSGKKAIGAGAGNPPVVVDETADIKKAAKDIIDGCTFDNNLPCIAEKEVIAVEKIYRDLLDEILKQGVYKLNALQISKLENLVLMDGKLNKKLVGKDAKVILDQIGINVSDDIRCIICETDEDHPFVMEELMMPILPIVKAKNIDDAIRIAVKAEKNNRHTAHIHSKNIDNITRYAKAINTTILVKNAPSYAGIGFGGEGFTTFTIAGPTGEGLTSAQTFTRMRRCVLADGLRII
ncbi:propionaldehyde dehydrogenase [Caldanaerobius fijiensis DSM 17918]|uniref:Propionaldehyde dehydrogenase n=1 Tax=Caldanaerobius fijiensis DSM 17918 TaxID=1121256 RepID=A0A1M4UFC4_9THEO|nr:aldehyde dehydrogenase family protein [Caldanaerobius fijiensis]SHE55492.1 propionaldehyde dehydrogenase [Caldanaerobius fijiensis DSM 17918]